MSKQARREVKALITAATWIAAVVAAAPIAAQAFPAKSVRIVVPAVPGGGTDILTRLLAPKLQAIMGQSIVVDNRAGASTNIGTEHVARAAPDGYTVLVATTPHAVDPTLFAKLPFGVEVVASTPDELAKLMPQEIVKWGKVVKASGAKPE